jgi:formylglycine-generating enzyme required for sulfatase activity
MTPLKFPVIFLAATLLSISATSRVRSDTFGSGPNTFGIEFVTVGNPGNPADTTGTPNPAGSVPYTYRIAKYEFSNEQIQKVMALSGIDSSHQYFPNVFGPTRPATQLTWIDAASVVNWLNTSTGNPPTYKFPYQPGDAEYVRGTPHELWLPGDPGYNPANPYRNSLAKYFLPSDNEWYKAAYYDPATGQYHRFATGSDTPPTSVPSGTAPNTAVYYVEGVAKWGQPAPVNEAGGLSPYGTMAQTGNVHEWEETAFDLMNDSISEGRGIRGGHWDMPEVPVSSQIRYNSLLPYWYDVTIGFRVASADFPEPSTSLLAIVAFGALPARRRKSGFDNRD